MIQNVAGCSTVGLVVVGQSFHAAPDTQDGEEYRRLAVLQVWQYLKHQLV
jgi:hypothetical protein